MNWYEAYAFCIWDGGFLPSEAEWEHATAGGSQQREFAWGETNPGTTSQYAIWDDYYPTGTSTADGVANVAPVGTASAGSGLWGQLDLTGSVWEWTMDSWDGTSPYVSPCTDCAYLEPASGRVHRGGCFFDPLSGQFAWERHFYPSGSHRDTHVGFRCARSP